MKLYKLCIALGVTSVLAIGSCSSAWATSWVMTRPATCSIHIVNNTNGWVRSSLYNDVTLAPHTQTTKYKVGVGPCSFGVPDRLVVRRDDNVTVSTFFDPIKNTYFIRFFDYTPTTAVGGKIVHTSNLHGPFSISPVHPVLIRH